MPPVSVSEMGLRIGLAFLAGFMVGWERESHGRPAGLRTNILACVAAAVAMLVSVSISANAAATTTGSLRADPARLGAGILAGMGFLGGGTILRQENFIRGVTTAATLWFVSVLGLAFGSGLLVLGGMGVAVGLITLFLLARFEKHLEGDWYSTLCVTGSLEALSEEELKGRVEALGPVVQNMKLSYDFESKQKTLTCDLKLERIERFELSTRIVNALAQTAGITRVEWK